MRLDPASRRVSQDPRDPAFFADPYPTYDAIRAELPVFWWEEYGYWCFGRHAEVNALLRDRRFGRQVLHVMSREELGWEAPPDHFEPVCAFERHSLLELEPPEHTRLRALVNHAFLGRVIERLRPRIEQVAHACIDRFEAAREVDLLEHFATPIPVVVIAEMLGVPAEMGPQLVAWSHDMVAIYQARRDEAIERRAAHATLEFSAYVRAQLEAKRRAPGEDLISALLAARESGQQLSEEELVSTTILLLNAGHEATVHAIGNGVHAWLRAGVDARAILSDPTRAPAAIEEVLRFDPPLHLFTRFCLEDAEIAGVPLRRGETIGLLLGSANRDPERFPEPARFDPARSPNPHVSFGAGIHFCVGAPLARLELQCALRVLFERLPGLRLAEPARYRDTYHFHGLEALRVAW